MFIRILEYCSNSLSIFVRTKNRMEKGNNLIIIGSGLGGLISGVILSKKGYKITILEKNHQIGGALQAFNSNGHTFSTGMHYMGSLDKGQTLHKIFKHFNLFDGIEYKRLDEEAFDIFNIDGQEYKFPIGFGNFRNQMHQYFPHDKRAIDTYVDEINKAINSQDIYLLKTYELKSEDTNKYLKLNTWEFVKSITNNKRLQHVLCALNFVYAGEKEKSPFYIHALINNHFISSSYRIIGSTAQIAKKLTNQIENNGGIVLTKKEVDKLIIVDNKVVQVNTSDGCTYSADHVISNLHPATTMKLIPDGSIKKSFRNRMMKKENTISAFAVHIVLKDNTFKYLNANYNYYKNDDVWYASYYDKKNWPEHYFMHCSPPENGSTYTKSIGLLTHMKFEEVEKWSKLPINKRGDEYLEFKTKKAEQLIELAKIKFPELEGNIEGFNVSTPLTYNDYLGSPQGSMYGTMRDCINPIGSYISPRTKINNLFFTGQNINLHGILGVSLSAIITCGEFVGKANIIKEINENE